jgi:hypothetical protein
VVVEQQTSMVEMLAQEITLAIQEELAFFMETQRVVITQMVAVVQEQAITVALLPNMQQVLEDRVYPYMAMAFRLVVVVLLRMELMVQMVHTGEVTAQVKVIVAGPLLDLLGLNTMPLSVIGLGVK